MSLALIVKLHRNLSRISPVFAFLFDPLFLDLAQPRRGTHGFLTGQFSVHNLGQF
jgi:hypothetical protein